MSGKRANEEQEAKEGDSDRSDVTSPGRAPSYDFFADIKRRKLEEQYVKIKGLRIGKNVTRDLIVAVTWKSLKPEKVFTFQGHDGEEMIVFKVFGVSIKRFSDRVMVSETYTLRNFVVKTVDEIYRTSLDGKFEIVLSTDCVMEVAEEKLVIPFTPVPLDQIDECEPDRVIDVEGILVAANDVRTTSNNKTVREVYLVDTTKRTVQVNFWGKDAETLHLPLKVPVRLRNVQVKSQGKEKNLWFLWSSSKETEGVDLDGQMAEWFMSETEGFFKGIYCHHLALQTTVKHQLILIK